MVRIAVIVGRFQVDTPTTAHGLLLAHGLAYYDDTFIFAGEAITPNRKNILPNSAVRAMVRSYCDAVSYVLDNPGKYYVSNIKDMHNPPLWSSMLDEKIASLCRYRGYEEVEITLVGGRDSYIDPNNNSRYVGIHKNTHILITELGDEVSASAQRDIIKDEEPLDNDMYRRGMIKARLMMYPIAYQTVDVCIRYLDEDGEYYYLFGKKPNKNAYSFVGGFSDPTSDSLEEDACREAFEETDLIVNNATYAFSKRINDVRYIGTEDCIKTAMFIVDATSKDFNAKDPKDLSGLIWVKASEVSSVAMSDIHKPLLQILLDRNLIK